MKRKRARFSRVSRSYASWSRSSSIRPFRERSENSPILSRFTFIFLEWFGPQILRPFQVNSVHRHIFHRFNDASVRDKPGLLRPRDDVLFGVSECPTTSDTLP